MNKLINKSPPLSILKCLNKINISMFSKQSNENKNNQKFD